MLSQQAVNYRVAGEIRVLKNTEVEYEQAVYQTVEQKTEQCQKKKEVEEEFDGINEYQDWDFTFIAGYTSGGVPYVIRWEDMPDEEDLNG